MQKQQLIAYQLGIIGQFHCPELPPIILMGRSGIGKTALTFQLAEAFGKRFYNFEMSGKRAEDISGYGVPDHDTGTMRFYPDAFVSEILNCPNGSVLMNFDEIADLPPSVEISMHPVLCGKRFGTNAVPNRTAITGQGNPPEVSTTGGALAPAVVRRVCILDVEIDPNVWADGNEVGFKNMDIIDIDDGWLKHIPQERAMVSAFIRINPSALDRDAAESHLPAPCPRQWTNVALYNALCKGTEHMSARLELIKGCIGEELALQYVKWEAEQDVPDWRDVLDGSCGKSEWPNRGDQIHILAKSCVAGTLSEFNTKNVQACWNFLAELCRMDMGDLAAIACPPLANAGFPRGWNGVIPKEIEEFASLLDEANIQ